MKRLSSFLTCGSLLLFPLSASAFQPTPPQPHIHGPTQAYVQSQPLMISYSYAPVQPWHIGGPYELWADEFFWHCPPGVDIWPTEAVLESNTASTKCKNVSPFGHRLDPAKRTVQIAVPRAYGSLTAGTWYVRAELEWRLHDGSWEPSGPYSPWYRVKVTYHLRVPKHPEQGVIGFRKRNASAVKLNPQPEPPSSVSQRPPPIAQSAQGAKLTMHKIGLAPRPGVEHPSGLPAVQLPSGWTNRGGIVRARRAGLRLKLSGGRVLLSRLASNGRVSYLLLNAGGRVIKRIRSNETLRFVSNGTLMVQDTTGRHRQVFLGQITKARGLR